MRVLRRQNFRPCAGLRAAIVLDRGTARYLLYRAHGTIRASRGVYDLPALSIFVRRAIARTLVGRAFPATDRSTPLSVYVVPLARVETRRGRSKGTLTHGFGEVYPKR